MRAAGWLVVMLASCRSAPPPMPQRTTVSQPKRPPSSECVLEANSAVDFMVQHVRDEAEIVWEHTHDNPEYGAPSKLDKEAFTSFLATSEGRDWICGIRGFCASYYRGTLDQCETARVSTAHP